MELVDQKAIRRKKIYLIKKEMETNLEHQKNWFNFISRTN
jgi:hypothetical protein